MSSKKAARLFESFKPSNYKLEITLDPKSMKFSGYVTIRGLKSGRPSRRLTFHARGLNVSEAVLHKVNKKGSNTDGEAIKIDRINLQKSYEEVRLHTTEMLYPGEYHLVLTFNGKITDHMQGLYPCNFIHDGKEKFLLATQFESHHAREVFPCIDEPEAKATFDLAINMPDDFGTVLSNMPARFEEVEKGFRTTLFDTTPVMSTYLLAFVAGEMHYVESKTKDDIVVRSWSTVAQPKSTLQYSVDEGVRILEFFTDYFQTPYPLSKCDQVALPDFDAGAMENWGLITYREIALLTDAKNRSISNEQYVSMVIAHELSHQWFGNLVTMKWWDDLWLNESFASLMEHIALDKIHPDWQQWEHYVSSDVIATTNRDIYSHIQSVHTEVTDPELIETLFDPGIVYAKGGRLLKMVLDYIGEDSFRMGLKAYFDKHAYQNATRDDLWEALGKASRHDLKKLMNPWLRQSGMPVVSVDQTGDTLKLNQQRYLLDDAKDGQTWPIPLLADQETTPDLFDTETGTVKLESSEPVLLNRAASGHYFVHYTAPSHREYLNKAIETQKIATESRINILNDTYMLARRGDAPLTDALDTIAGLNREPRDSVWFMISRVIGTSAQLTEGDETSEKLLKQLRVSLAKHWFEKLGWDDQAKDDANTKQLRHTALALMLAGEDTSATNEALKRFDASKNLDKLPAETRSSMLVAAVRSDHSDAVDTLVKLYPKASPDFQQDIVQALSATKDPKAAKKILSGALGKNGFVRPQDVMRWLAYFLRNRHTRAEAWKFMENNWAWLKQTLEHSKSFDFLPTYCASVISTPEWAKKYRDFFEPLKDIKVLQRNIAVGLSDIDARVAWRTRDEAKIAAWLKTALS